MTKVFTINQNIIQICNNKNMKLFSYNSVNIILKRNLNIKKTKKYKLILEITILSLKNHFLFINFLDLYFIIYIYLI